MSANTTDPRISFAGIERPCDLYFVRHGESVGNKLHRVQGHTDMPLSEEGENQAAKAGTWFESRRIDRIVSSPLIRAKRTAQIIASRVGVDPDSILESRDVMELNTGVFSDMSFEEIREQQPQLHADFRHASWEAVPGAERISELLERACRHWNSLIALANSGCESVLTVTHGGIMQWLFKASFGVEWKSWIPLVHTGNCGVYHFFIEPVKERKSTVPGNSYFCEWKLVDYRGFI